MTAPTFLQAIEGETSETIAVLERLRRWLEVRPGIVITLSSRVVADRLSAVASVEWSYPIAPPGLHGTWATIVETERAAWPLFQALQGATARFEATEAAKAGLPPDAKEPPT